MAIEQDILAKLRALSNVSSSTPQQSLRPTLPGRASMGSTSLSERLPVPAQQRFSPTVGRAQAKLNTYTRNSASEFPSLSERLKLIKGGQVQQSNGLGGIGGAILNNPITKTALGALSVIDTPRRAVISGLREATDYFDTDPNTKASFGDFLNQTADTEYGFGTAFPMKGALGRVVGFLGDVAFDPLTYATLGSTVAKKAVVKGVFDASGKPMLLREALGGVKNVAGREGAVALAGLAERMGASPRLIQAIARDGKRAFRRLDAGYADEGVKLAESMGLQKNGIYYLGSRIKVPFSGVIADGIESGLVGARLGVLKHVPGATRFQELITPRGTSSTKELKVARAGLRRGEGSADRASLLVRSEAMHFAERANANIAADVYAKGVKVLMEDNDIINAGADIYKFLDSPETAWTRPMTPGEKLAYDKYKPFWENLHKDVEDAIRQVEPNFVLGKQDNFFPHVRTEAAERLAEDVSARGEQIRQYLKYDPTDPAGSFRSRQLKAKSEWFGHELTQADVDGGVDRLNYLAKNPKVVNGVPVAEAMTENFFETDVMSVLKKYGDHYSSQIGLAYALQKGLELDVMRQAKIGAELTDTFVDSVDTAVKSTKKGVKKSGDKVRGIAKDLIVAAQNALQDVLDTTVNARLVAAQNLDSTVPYVSNTVDALRTSVTNLIEARSARTQAVKAFENMFLEKNIIVDSVMHEANAVDVQLEKTIKTIQGLISSIETVAPGTKTVVFEGKERTVASTLKMLEKRAKTLGEKMNSFDSTFEHMDSMVDTVELIIGSNIQDVASTGDNMFDRLLSITNSPDSRLAGVPGARKTSSNRGGLTEDFMSEIFQNETRYPEFARVRKIINPTNDRSMSPRVLSKIFLEDVTDKEGNVLVRGIKNRIYSGVTTGKNQDELRQSALWLIARDYRMHSIRGKTGELTLDAATLSRHENLIALMEESDVAQRIMNARAANTRSGVRDVGLGGKPLTKSEELKSKLYNTAARYVDKQQELTDNVKMLESTYENIADGAVPTPTQQLRIDSAQKIVDKNRLELEKIGKTIPYAERNVADKFGQTNGLIEQNLRLANAVSEYYIHRETSIQVGRISELLAFTGFEPTPELYKTILGRIANDERVGLGRFVSRFTEAEQVLVSLRASLDGSPNKSLLLKEKLRKIFEEIQPPAPGANAAEIEAHRVATNNQQLIREFMPELEAVWGKARGTRTSRQFYNDSRAPQFGEELAAVAKDLGVTDEVTRGITRNAHPVYSPDGPLLSADGQVIDYSELSGMSITRGSEAYQNSQIDALQGNVEKLLKMVESMEDARISGASSNRAKRVSAEIARTQRLKIKEEYDAAVNAIEAEFDTRRFGAGAGSGKILGPEDSAQRKQLLQLAKEEQDVKLRDTKDFFRLEQQAQEVVPVVDNSLTQSIGELLPDGTKLKPTTKAELRSPRVKKLRETYETIMSDIANNQAAAKAVKRRVVSAQGKQSANVLVKGIVGPGEHNGLAAMISDSLTGGNRQVDALFAELLGGEKTIISPNQTVGPKTAVRSTKQILESNSYFGKTKYRVGKRMNNLAILSNDPTISSKALLEGVPGSYNLRGTWDAGSWAYNADLHGASGLADSLDEHANMLVNKANEMERRSVRTAQLVKQKDSPASPALKAIDSATSEGAVELAVRRANIRSAARAAKRTVEPAIKRLKKMQSQPMFARAMHHEAEQKFALELAKVSDDYAVRSGLFTPLEWLSLWNDGAYKIKPSEEYLFGDIRGYITNQIDILRKERAVTFRQGRPVKGIDNKIAAFERGLSGEFNLDEFKDAAYTKFRTYFNQFGDSPNKYFMNDWSTNVNKVVGSSDFALEHSAYGFMAGEQTASVRSKLLVDRFDATPESAYLRAIDSEKEKISDGMVQHMLRQPDAVSREKVSAEYLRRSRGVRTPESIFDATETARESVRQTFVGVDRLGQAPPPKYVSAEARGIYREAEELRAQGARIRSKHIKELEESIGLADRRQMEASVEMAQISKDIESMLVSAGVKVKPNQKPLKLAAQAERTAAGLRPMASAYEGIDSVIEKNIRKKVIKELGYEPGQFAGRNEKEIKNFLKNNKRIQKLIRGKQVTASRSSLESFFETRMQQEVTSFRNAQPRVGANNFVVNPQLRAEALAVRAGNTAVDSARMQELIGQIVELRFSENYKEMSGMNIFDDLFKSTIDDQISLSRNLALQQIELGRQLVQAQDAVFNIKTSRAFKTTNINLGKAEQAVANAEDAFTTATLYDDWGPQNIELIKLNVAQMEQLIKRGGVVSKGSPGITTGIKKGAVAKDWMEEVETFIEESRYQINQMSGGKVSSTPAINRVEASYLKAKKQYLDSTVNMDIAMQEALQADWVKGLTGTQLGGLPGQPGFGPSAMQMTVTFDEGFVQLSKFYPNIGVRKEVADIFQNVHRVGDPVIAEQLQKYIGRYTRFFKAYATLSPGFHVRNAISNAFMLFAAGGNPAQMAKGLDLSRRWIEASKNNINVDDWIKSLPEAEQLIARGTIEAAAASGGGQINDFLSEVTPFGTKFMKEKGRWIEQHSRFVLAYDGVASGMTPQQASARVKRYLIDYQDISSLDSVMRQIVPFWMWTSRNFPMQLQNMWTNPRSYQIFNSIKRNMSDDQEGDIVPEWMVKAGAFKLPFGTDLYATPDIGFNRLGQQLEEFVTPSKYMANVNPLLRVPLELMNDKQYFSGKQFSKNPVEVSGGSSEFLQPLLQILGYGQTTEDGKKFVSDKAYYGFTSLLPTLGQAERLIPSKTSAPGGIPFNALLGLAGAPVKQNTESYMLGELARRKSLAQAEVSKEKALKGD